MSERGMRTRVSAQNTEESDCPQVRRSGDLMSCSPPHPPPTESHHPFSSALDDGSLNCGNSLWWLVGVRRVYTFSRIGCETVPRSGAHICKTTSLHTDHQYAVLSMSGQYLGKTTAIVMASTKDLQWTNERLSCFYEPLNYESIAPVPAALVKTDSHRTRALRCCVDRAIVGAPA